MANGKFKKSCFKQFFVPQSTTFFNNKSEPKEASVIEELWQDESDAVSALFTGDLSEPKTAELTKHGDKEFHRALAGMVCMSRSCELFRFSCPSYVPWPVMTHADDAKIYFKNMLNVDRSLSKRVIAPDGKIVMLIT